MIVARSQSMRAQNSDSDPIFVNNFTCPSVGKTMHYAFTSIFLDACVQDQRRQFFPHGSNIYSSDIEFLVNGVSNLLSHKASSLNSRGWERAAPCADGNYSTIQYFGDES